MYAHKHTHTQAGTDIMLTDMNLILVYTTHNTHLFIIFPFTTRAQSPKWCCSSVVIVKIYRVLVTKKKPKQTKKKGR